MNIAIFTDFFLPSIGGVQTSIVNQKRVLEAAGHSVLIFAPAYKGHAPFVEQDGVIRLPVIPGVAFEQHRAFLALPKHRKRTESILRAMKADIIHVQTEFSIGLMGADIAKRMGIPLVYTVHTLLWQQVKHNYRFPSLSTVIGAWYVMLYRRKPLPKIRRFDDADWTERLIQRSIAAMCFAADAVVSPSTHLADKLRSATSLTTFTVIPNPAPVSRDAIKPLPKEPTLLWVGLMNHVKRPLALLEAINLLQGSTKKKFTVRMLGTGPLEEECKKRASKMPSVQIYKAVGYDDMVRFYDESSALVVTSYKFENQPMVIAEALTRGRGVVVCDPDLMPDGLDAGAGTLSGHTPEELAHTLKDLIENPGKLDRMAKMSEMAAERFSERHYLKKIEALYSSLKRK